MDPQEIVLRIREHYKEPKIELSYNNPFELLVALILSAQCTDKVTNRITKTLFERFRTPEDFCNSSIDEINSLIKSCTMHNNKAKNIYNISKILVERYNSKIPNDFIKLVQLPGVARKTANILLSFGFGIPTIGVDTHVLRVSNRLGLSESKKPDRVEEDLKLIFSQEDWVLLYSSLILHGRYVCKANHPLCGKCFLNDMCLKIGV